MYPVGSQAPVLTGAFYVIAAALPMANWFGVFSRG